MPLAAELVGRGSVLLVSQVLLYWPRYCCCLLLSVFMVHVPGDSPVSAHLASARALSTDVEVGMDFYLLNWHQLALQPEALKKRNIHLNNLCPSNLCNFRNALDEDLCLCLIKQMVLVLVSFIKVLCRKIIFKFSVVENPQFVCMWFSIEILLFHVQLRALHCQILYNCLNALVKQYGLFVLLM